jgi:hypothetical protein
MGGRGRVIGQNRRTFRLSLVAKFARLVPKFPFDWEDVKCFDFETKAIDKEEADKLWKKNGTPLPSTKRLEVVFKSTKRKTEK